MKRRKQVNIEGKNKIGKEKRIIKKKSLQVYLKRKGSDRKRGYIKIIGKQEGGIK